MGSIEHYFLRGFNGSCTHSSAAGSGAVVNRLMTNVGVAFRVFFYPISLISASVLIVIWKLTRDNFRYHATVLVIKGQHSIFWLLTAGLKTSLDSVTEVQLQPNTTPILQAPEFHEDDQNGHSEAESDATKDKEAFRAEEARLAEEARKVEEARLLELAEARDANATARKELRQLVTEAQVLKMSVAAAQGLLTPLANGAAIETVKENTAAIKTATAQLR
ncbi:MAG: hypothetical protein LBF26_00695, partial [Puniceicoccales bacterium]|nr:hypothetical protein [Puniceicoccales bacterium]